MKFSVIFLSAFLLAQTTLPDSLVGDWTNQNPQTNGITQITVRTMNSRTLVHAGAHAIPSTATTERPRPSFGMQPQ